MSSSELPEAPDVLWQFSVEKGAFEATPLIVDGVVYIPDMDGEIYALKLATGELLWKVETESGYLASAAHHNGVLIVGDYDGLIRALRATDGHELWQYQTNAQIDSGANFYESLVLMTSEDGSLYALDFETGKLQWTYATGDQLRCAPTIIGDKTFLGGCDSELHIVDLKTGTLLGEKLPLGGPTGSTPAGNEDVLIVPTHPGPVFGFDWKSQKQLWRFADAERSPEVRSSPAIHGGTAYVTTRARRLLALDASTGQMKWEALLRKRSDSSPVVCSNRVWVGATDGRIYAFDLQSGKETWMIELPGAFQGSPAIAANRLVIASDKGTVYCFGQKTLAGEQ